MGGAGGKGCGWRSVGGRGTPRAPRAKPKDPRGPPNSRSWLWLGAGRETPGTGRLLGQQERGGRISTADSAQAGKLRSAPPLCPPPGIGTTDSALTSSGKSWVGGELTRGQETYPLPSWQQSRPRPLTSCMTLGESHHLSGPSVDKIPSFPLCEGSKSQEKIL